MKDDSKSKKQLIDELTELRRQLASLQGSSGQGLAEKSAEDFFAVKKCPIPILISTLEEGRFEEVSDAFLKVSGFGRGEVIGKTAAQIGVNPEVWALLRTQLNEYGQIEENEFRFKTKGGQTGHGMLNSVVVNHNGRKYVLSVIVDLTERKRAEEALRQSEATLKSIFTATPVGLCIMKDRIFQSVNGAWYENFGYSESDLIGKSPRMLYESEEEYDRAGREMYSNLSAGNLAKIQTRLRREDGVFRDVILRAAPLPSDDASQRTVVAVDDISDYKSAMKEVEENRRQLADIIDFLPDATLVVDRSGKVIAWNRAMEEMTGIKAKDMLGKGDQEYSIPFYGRKGPLLADLVLHPDPEAEKKYTHLHRRGDILFGERHTPNLKPGNRHLYASASCLRDSDGEIVAAIQCIRDNTERKLAEEALRESEGRYRELFEAESDAIFLFDRKGGRILEANSAAVALYGYSREELLTKRINDMWAVPDEKITSAFSNQIAYFPLRYHRKKDGTVFPVEAIGREFKWRERAVRISAIRDITLRKKEEEERRALEERLQRAEKMESLGIMAGGVAHDLNNILGVMMGYSELMLYRLKDHPIREQAGNIMKSAERAAAIVQDMLTLARRGVVTKKALNLNSIIGDQFKTPEYEKLISSYPGVRVETDLSAQLLNMTGSPVHLGKTVMNLLSNALESIKEEGTVTVTTANQYLDRAVSGYDQVSPGDYVVLSVSDTGEGILSEDLKRIFEPFYTKKVMGRSGTGLGLSVVWGTVKDHAGYIDVWSRPAGGATFRLYFPVTREEAVGEAHVPPTAYLGKGETILVVDDAQEQRELATLMLSRLNYNVISAASGEAALEFLKGTGVDLVVLDMIMDPGMDGLETYRKMIEIRPGQKAIIVSGFAETERVKEAQELGAGPFVAKPYITEKIGLAVRRELDKK